MSRISFENYAIRAKELKSFTSIAGRHDFQAEDEKRIVLDIYNKLDISTKDDCLEIGCGTGNLLIPLSFFVKSITGIDNDMCIERLNKRFSDEKNVKFICGNFLDLEIEQKFDKIIIYSVLHYLEDENQVMAFIFKALRLLNKGGKMILGDIPNKSKMERFNNSDFGKNFKLEYAKKVAQFNENNEENQICNILKEDLHNISFDDNFIFRILRETREKGYDAYILPQPEGLPFNYTREDIIIENLK